jgi:DNA-binding NtrC family response regulator
MPDGILFISSNRVNWNTLSGMLRPVSIRLDPVPDLRQARDRISSQNYPVILTETRLSDGTWNDVLSLTRELGLPSVVIVTDRLADDLLWAEVLNLGAYDLLVQPFDAGEVQRILLNACSQAPQKPVQSHTASTKRNAQAAL